MSSENQKEVKFDKYCKTCKHWSARPQGEWIDVVTGDQYKMWSNLTCPECGTVFEEIYSPSLYNFCPNCGADMRGDTK